MKQVDVFEFKAACLRLLDEARQTGRPIEILKNGKPLAVVQPALVANRDASFGALRSTLTGGGACLASQ